MIKTHVDIDFMYSRNFREIAMRNVIWRSEPGTIFVTPVIVLKFLKIRDPNAILTWCEKTWGHPSAVYDVVNGLLDEYAWGFFGHPDKVLDAILPYDLWIKNNEQLTMFKLAWD